MARKGEDGELSWPGSTGKENMNPHVTPAVPATMPSGEYPTSGEESAHVFFSVCQCVAIWPQLRDFREGMGLEFLQGV